MDKKDLISSHHSNVYDNFLMHWKYIKREKVGDKWKYTYKDDAVTDARTKLGKSVIDYKKAVATENKLKADKTHDGELSKANLDMADARVEAWQATNNAKREVEKARKEYDAAKAKSDASIGNRIAKALNGEKSTKEAKDKGVVEKQLSNGVTYTVPYNEKLDGPKEDTSKKERKSLAKYMNTPLRTALKATETLKDARIEVEIAIDKIGKKIASIGKKDSSKETLSDMNSKNVPESTIEQEVITDKDIPSKKKEIVKTFDNSSKTFDDDAKTRDDATGVIPNISKNKSADVSRNQLGWINAKRDLTNEEIKAESEQAKEVFDSYFKNRHKLEDCQSSIFCETYEDVDPKTKAKTGTYTSVIYLKKNDGQQLVVSQITKPDKNTSDVKKIRDAISDHYMEKKFGQNWNSAYRSLKKK